MALINYVGVNLTGVTSHGIYVQYEEGARGANPVLVLTVLKEYFHRRPHVADDLDINGLLGMCCRDVGKLNPSRFYVFRVDDMIGARAFVHPIAMTLQHIIESKTDVVLTFAAESRSSAVMLARRITGFPIDSERPSDTPVQPVARRNRNIDLEL